MRWRSTLLVFGVCLLAVVASGCASTTGDGDAPEVAQTADTTPTDTSGDAAARAQAQAWLDAAVLPPGAVSSQVGGADFLSYQAWPCQPVEELEAFWTVPGMTVTQATNWLIAHPTADLITTAGGPVPEGDVDAASVGYIPGQGAQEGIVYTVAKMTDGVAVRAEVAALAEDAVCSTPPGGGMWGAPGQG
jgi:hypothetical protein